MSNPQPGEVWVHRETGMARQVVYVNADGSVVVKRFGKDHAVAAYDWPEWSASAVRVFPPVETPPSGETQLRSEIRELQARDDAQNELRIALVEEILGGVSLSPREETIRQFIDEARVKLFGAARVLKEKRAARVVETPDGSGVQHGHP
jgi:hypothetical protein